MRKLASARAENGVWVAGLQTKVQPAASAGPALRPIIALGKFHGVIAQTTQTGLLQDDDALVRGMARITSP